MNTRLGVSVLVFGWLGLLSVLALQDDQTKKDLAAMKGEWKVVKADRNGHAASDELLQKMKVSITDDTITVDDGKRKDPAKFKLNPATQPKQIDILPEGNSNRTILGIYEINKGVLRICYLRGEGDRPKEFVSKAESRLVLMELKRP